MFISVHNKIMSLHSKTISLHTIVHILGKTALKPNSNPENQSYFYTLQYSQIGPPQFSVVHI